MDTLFYIKLDKYNFSANNELTQLEHRVSLKEDNRIDLICQFVKFLTRFG